VPLGLDFSIFCNDTRKRWQRVDAGTGQAT